MQKIYLKKKTSSSETIWYIQIFKAITDDSQVKWYLKFIASYMSNIIANLSFKCQVNCTSFKGNLKPFGTYKVLRSSRRSPILLKKVI